MIAYRNKYSLFLILGLVISMVSYRFVYAASIDPLPKNIRIYVNELGMFSNVAEAGYEPKKLPVVNLFIRTPGCYITCQTANSTRGIYRTSNRDIYVVGLIRVEGEYEGPFCRPRDYERTNIKDEPIFESLCSRAYQCIGNSCWATSDTGDLFNLK